MNIRPFLGDFLRYHVQSRSRPDIWHLVDLCENDGEGWCGCEDYEFRKLPCEHIRAAQIHLAIATARRAAEQRRQAG